MDIGTEITISCGRLSRGARPGVELLAVALGAMLYENMDKYTCLPETVRGKSNLVPVTVTLNTNLMCNDEFIMSQVTIDPRELIGEPKYPAYAGWGLKTTIEDYAAGIRTHLAARLGTFIQGQAAEALAPLPPYNDTGCYFRGNKVFLESTGDRQKDRLLATMYTVGVNRRT